MNFDVFNGDADGICALLQLRLHEPKDSILVTGVKRDISLLKRVDAAAGDSVTVLDVSLDLNRSALVALLDKQVDVFYVDHHQAGEVPSHPLLHAIIDTDANVCTSLLVDRYLKHRFSAWAVVAAFGDNLASSAEALAQNQALSEIQLHGLRQLGVCINYNGYGASIDDLLFAPEELYRRLSGYVSPLDFIRDQSGIYAELLEGYHGDMRLVGNILAEYATDKVAVFVLPDAKWARRVIGVWSNELANQNPFRAHAVLSPNSQHGYVVSVRAPLSSPTGADEVCGLFPSGGGRKAAAGINHLPAERVDALIGALNRQYGC